MNKSRDTNSRTSSRGGSAEPVRPVYARRRDRRRHFFDGLARRLVSVGGFTILAAIFAIIIVILVEIIPLFTGIKVEEAPPIQIPLDGKVLISGMDEYREVAFILDGSGKIHLISILQGRVLETLPLPGLGDARPVDVCFGGENHYAVAASDGRIFLFRVDYTVTYAEDRRRVSPRVRFQEPIPLYPHSDRAPLHISYAETDDGPVIAAYYDPEEALLYRRMEETTLFGDVRWEEVRTAFTPPGSKVSRMAMDRRGEDLFFGTQTGLLYRYHLSGGAAPVLEEGTAATRRSSISVLGFLIGDRTLVVGSAAGEVSSWQLVRQGTAAKYRLTRIYDFEPHSSPVTSFDFCQRNRGFLTGDAKGRMMVRYGTTGATLASEQVGDGSLSTLSFAPKGDGMMAVGEKGRLFPFRMDNPHPDVTWRSLFGKIWYEGYTEPTYVWQSTGATDDYESKLGLVPVIFGTLKGTAYSMLFAIPIALLGALYTSQFMHPRLKATIKPTVEIMAALPSVILGLIGGLWLAPVVEKSAPGILIMPFVIGAVILAAVILWKGLPQRVQGLVKAGNEVFLLIPVVILGGWLSFRLSPLLETWALGGDYRQWLHTVLGTTYDQRNSLVVGIAMGFAVIPIIFTIAEDSLSNVPRHLSAASLALGATPWTTAIRVVLPTASPGIFSAIMIGFGRAVGETMIVLMATGNTPIMDWSIFNGFRALSANIAVEIPEAPHGGSLYRVLFVAALLLFIMTFIVNTAAELVRLRLRKKYRYL